MGFANFRFQVLLNLHNLHLDGVFENWKKIAGLWYPPVSVLSHFKRLSPSLSLPGTCTEHTVVMWTWFGAWILVPKLMEWCGPHSNHVFGLLGEIKSQQKYETTLILSFNWLAKVFGYTYFFIFKNINSYTNIRNLRQKVEIYFIFLKTFFKILKF